MKKCLILLLTLCFALFKHDIALASSEGNYGSNNGGASKLNLGIWLPSMTLKLPKFNLPKIKISATIKPKKNQPPLKIHLPEVSLNAKALSDDGGYHSDSRGYDHTNSLGYAINNNGEYNGNNGYNSNNGYNDNSKFSSNSGYNVNEGYNNGNKPTLYETSLAGNTYDNINSYKKGYDGNIYNGYNYEKAAYGSSSNNNDQINNFNRYNIPNDQEVYQSQNNFHKQKKDINNNNNKQYNNSPNEQYRNINDNQNVYSSESNKINYNLNNGNLDTIFVRNENRQYDRPIEQISKYTKNEPNVYGYSIKTNNKN